MSFHDELVNEGFDASSDEYYTEIDQRIRKEFPHKFEDKNKGSRPVQAVASANRSTKAGRKVVRLTPSQIAIAKRLGVPLSNITVAIRVYHDHQLPLLWGRYWRSLQRIQIRQ